MGPDWVWKLQFLNQVVNFLARALLAHRQCPPTIGLNITMKKQRLLSTLCSGLFICLLSSAHASSPRPLIFDTDMAIDDWSALLVLAMHEELELLAVTSNGAGETRCAPAMKNIAALLDLTPSGDVLIACGDDYPMDGYFAFPEPWREQADTLSGVPLPGSTRTASEKHAVDVIHTSLADSNAKVVIVATGSLTNIAQWLEKYPGDTDRVQRLVIMGGAFAVPGNIIVPGFTDNHPNTKAEWNIFVDPEAAARVFASGLPIEVVGLDVTNQVKVTKEFAREFKATAKTPAAQFWDAVLDDNDWFIESGEYYFWDVLAALVALDPTFCTGEMEPVTVSLEAGSPWQPSSLRSIPNTTYRGAGRRHLNAGKSGITRIGGNNPPVKICRETDAARAFTLFTRTLNRS